MITIHQLQAIPGTSCVDYRSGKLVQQQRQSLPYSRSRDERRIWGKAYYWCSAPGRIEAANESINGRLHCVVALVADRIAMMTDSRSQRRELRFVIGASYCQWIGRWIDAYECEYLASIDFHQHS